MLLALYILGKVLAGIFCVVVAMIAAVLAATGLAMVAFGAAAVWAFRRGVAAYKGRTA